MARLSPAFDDAAIALAGREARAVWAAASARERDRLLRLPAAERLAAMDGEAARLLLTPEHRAELRASVAPACSAEPHPGEDQDFQEELAAWWARDAEAQAEAARARAMRRANWWALAAAGVGALAGAALLGWPLALMVAWLCGAGVLVLRARAAGSRRNTMGV